MADRSTLQRGPGSLVNRIEPTGWVPPEGTAVWCFGSDLAGWTGIFKTNDRTELGQTDTLAGGTTLVRARAFLRGPRAALPTGWRWEAYGVSGSGDAFVFVLDPRSARAIDDMALGVRAYSGGLSFGLRAIGPASEGVELEIPAFYLDSILMDDAAAVIELANRVPVPGETQVDKDHKIYFDLFETGSSDIDLNATQVYVDGVLAYDGALGGAQNGFNVVVTAPDTSQHRFVITPPYEYDSLRVVPVRVVSANVSATFALDTTYSFTAEDRTAPRVLAAQAIDHFTVRVTFDEPVKQVDATDSDDALNPDNWSFAYQTAPSVSVEAVSVASVSPTVVDITVDIPLTMGATYRVTGAQIIDLFENVLIAPYDYADFIAYSCPRPDNRDFELWMMIPRMNRDEDDTRDLFKFVSILQEVVDLLLCDVDRWTDILDVDLAAERYVDQMLITLGNPFAFALDLDGKRRLVRVLVRIYQLKGTSIGVIDAVRFFLGLEITIEEWAAIGWVLGVDDLGDTTILGPGTLREIYTFEVISPILLTDEQRSTIRTIVEYMKPGHTHLGGIVEPVVPDVIDHLELGTSELADEWVLH